MRRTITVRSPEHRCIPFLCWVDATRKKHLDNAMLPAVRKVEDVEEIRDGGSLAATFESDIGDRYILFAQIKYEATPCYDQPVLIDCDPAKRPPDTERIFYSELSGPHITITWSQARNLVDEISKLNGSMDQFQRRALQKMIDVVGRGGVES